MLVTLTIFPTYFAIADGKSVMQFCRDTSNDD